MPVSVVHSKKDEAKWNEAKQAAAKSKGKSVSDLKDNDYALVMHIYQNMKKSEDGDTLTTGNVKDLTVVVVDGQQSFKSNEVYSMSNEKKYTAKEAAVAVLKKAEEMLKNHELMKAAPKIKLSSDHDKNSHLYTGDKGTSKLGGTVRSANRSKSWAKDSRSSGPSIERSMAKDKMGEAKSIASKNLANTKAQPKPNLTKDEHQPKHEIHPKEPQAGESEQPGQRIKETANPQPTDINPKVNGNPEWGTTPGVVKGHIKLAKFCGHMEAKRKQHAAPAQTAPAQAAIPQPGMGKAETGHEKGIHTSHMADEGKHGTSTAGALVRRTLVNVSPKGVTNKQDAVGEHKKVLSEIKAQPKPNLPK